MTDTKHALDAWKRGVANEKLALAMIALATANAQRSTSGGRETSTM